jgi:acetoin utilization deacetylase AcuC-like enzyme
MRARASGFGVPNDAAVAIAWLVERGRHVAVRDCKG